MSLAARLNRSSTALSLVVLAALAYVPALASSPGRMPADTKLYLYLDPAGLLGRAASTFEPDQFAGWVPFQQITYLWPSGPWYLLFETIGVPDWVAHRLWIGTIMFLAGAGVLWAARILGVSRLGALAGAMVYQLSPFLLAYVSRTSLLLLPWAGLGWIVALTIRATLPAAPADLATRWRRRLSPWRDPALIALIVATVGSTNATTLAMIVPAPVLWIVHVTWQRRIAWRRAAAVTARITALCLAVSTWWIAMLYVQSRNGPAVLAYTETLADVSRNATGTEVLRGLGYWLFYQRDPAGPTTTASLEYLVSLRAIAVSFAIVLIGLAGIALTSWAQRRFAAMCVAVGIVLAVGVHPISEPSPLMSLFVGDDGSGLALALRSSTRAIPVFLLGLALGVGALVTAIPQPAMLPAGARRVPTVRLLAALGVGLLAVANLPSLWNRAFVDPAIDRDQDPPSAWSDAVDRLADSDPAARVLQIPGAEFGAFRWGYTTDHPLVGLTDKPVVTRDLLPLGSPAAMDLLFAFDDRIQEGTIEPASVAPVARLLGSDVVWLSNDAAFDRFRTARPEPLDAALTSEPLAPGISGVERFGEPTVNVADVAMDDPSAIVEPSVGRPVSPVTLLTVDEPVPVIRAKTESVVVSGSGDGIVDAAAAGLLSGHELVRFSASLSGGDLDAALDEANALLVTDTNRDQAHHWRGSQDVRGHTEPGGPDDDVLDATSADQRLEVFPSDPERQTIAFQVGAVTATASSYGEPFAYRPEDRAVSAIDGDPSTAWRVADHGDPVGERIRLEVGADTTTTDDDDPPEITQIRLRQPTPAPDGRSIASVEITVDGHDPVDVVLDGSSLSGDGQTVSIPAVAAGGAVTVEITGIVPGRFPLASSLAGVGFSEIDLGLGPTTEIVRVPTDGLDAVDADTPVALVLTRWRTDPADPWRADPERTLSRQFPLASTRTFDQRVTLRLDRRSSDTMLAEFLESTTGQQIATASSRVAGGVAQRGGAALDGDPSTAWVTGFDEAVGASLRFETAGALGDELVIDQPTGPYSPITAVRLSADNDDVDLVVPAPDAAGRSVVALPGSLPGSVPRSGPLELTITAVEERTTIDRRYGDPRVLPAAIAELTGTVGIEPVVVDDAAVVAVECSSQFLTVDDVVVPISFETTVGALLDGAAVEATGCEAIELASGDHQLTSADAATSALHVDRVVLSEPGMAPPATAATTVDVELTRNDPRARDVVVAPCPSGCWVVLGEGANPAWTASANGRSLGSGELVDGGFNGWWLAPGNDPTVVEFRWTAQRPVNAALLITLAAVLACIAIVFAAPRRAPVRLGAPTAVRSWSPLPRRRIVMSSVMLVVATTLLVSPLWGAIAVIPGAAAVVLAGRVAWAGRLFELTGLALAVTAAVSVSWIERRDRPFPNAGWTESFDPLNGLAVVAVLSLAVGAMFARDAESERR